MQYEILEIKPDNELSHHGIMGQKWGIRRFQFKDGSLTEEGRKRYGQLKSTVSKWKVRVKEKSEANKKAKEEADEAKKKRIAEEADEKKKNLIERGTPEQIQKNIHLFNSEELSSIERRFSTELRVRDEISRLTNSDKGNRPVMQVVNKKSPSEKITNATNFISNNLKNVESSVSNAVKAYNNIAAANNIFRPNAKQLPIIQIPKDEKKKQQRDGDRDGSDSSGGS